MIKTLRILLLALLFPGYIYACECLPQSEEPFSHFVSQYSFIARVKIKSVAKTNSPQESNGVAYIEVIDLFKGKKTDSLSIWGIGTSCDMGMKPGQEWIIFAHGGESRYTTNECTGSYLYNTVGVNDLPFFLTMEYRLKAFFGHPVPLLKNGENKISFPDGHIKSSFVVNNQKLDGRYIYISDYKSIYQYSFLDGKKHGPAYFWEPGGGWIFIYQYADDQLIETSRYFIEKNLVYNTSLAANSFIDSVLASPKKIERQKLALPDGSSLVKKWNHDGDLIYIEQEDSLGPILSIRFYNSGLIASHGIRDTIANVFRSTGYTENGVIESKEIYHGDKTEYYYYDKSGNLKKELIRQDGKIIHSKEY